MLEWQSLGSSTIIIIDHVLSIWDHTLAQAIRIVHVSMADRMDESGDERERRLIASSQ